MWQISWCIAPCSVEDPSVVCGLMFSTFSVVFSVSLLLVATWAVQFLPLKRWCCCASCSGCPGAQYTSASGCWSLSRVWWEGWQMLGCPNWELRCCYLWQVEPTMYSTPPHNPRAPTKALLPIAGCQVTVWRYAGWCPPVHHLANGPPLCSG